MHSTASAILVRTCCKGARTYVKILLATLFSLPTVSPHFLFVYTLSDSTGILYLHIRIRMHAHMHTYIRARICARTHAKGLEDGGGHSGEASLILQPVLSYGKSGCVLNPLHFADWWLTSFYVSGSGRAHCGKNVGPLDQGERVVRPHHDFFVYSVILYIIHILFTYSMEYIYIYLRRYLYIYIYALIYVYIYSG